jgi:tripartite-type tricarboxylate transporter receptor subunit TctC
MKTLTALRSLCAACLGLPVCGLPLAPANADAISDFYKGKSITLIISTGVGGGMDQTVRIVGRHWKKYLPGRPNFIAKNMPGAGHLRATNYLYNQVPKDGTAVAAIIPSFVHH